MTTGESQQVQGQPATVNLPAIAAGAAVVALAIATGVSVSAAQAMLLLTGVALGLTLYHASFGFTAAYRVFFANGRSAGIRAQMIMLAIACLLFFPAMASGTLFGRPVGGFVAPAGVSVAFGAFIFGIGMQLGGACASGTLFTAGGGNTRMALTLIFFIAGSMFGLEHLPRWEALPGLPAISVVEQLGWPAALMLNGALFAAIYLAARSVEHFRHGNVMPLTGPHIRRSASLLRGPWPLIAAAALLALLNFATLYQAGRPWGITSAFPLWGAKILSATGFDVSVFQSWATPPQQKALQTTVLADVTSVMNFGIMLGAMAAAALAGKFKPVWIVPAGQIAASIVGGLLLGYGARLSYGCNIGAFFSGVASGSLHGWLWIVCALAGNWIGVHLRPGFGMAVEWPASKC